MRSEASYRSPLDPINRTWLNLVNLGCAGPAFSPDGQTLALSGGDHTVSLWDVATGRERPVSRDHRRFVNHLAISPDGKTLASGGNEFLLRLWDAATGREKG